MKMIHSQIIILFMASVNREIEDIWNKPAEPNSKAPTQPKMATMFSFSSSNVSHLNSLNPYSSLTPQPNPRRSFYRVSCSGENPATNSATDKGSEPENALLKVAWNASELLGIATSFFRSPKNPESTEVALQLARDGSGSVDRALIVKTIKDDFERSYFVTGFPKPISDFGLNRLFSCNCMNNKCFSFLLLLLRFSKTLLRILLEQNSFWYRTFEYIVIIW